MENTKEKVKDTEEIIKIYRERAEKFKIYGLSAFIVTKDNIWVRGRIVRVFKTSMDVEDKKLGVYPVSFYEISRFEKNKSRGVENAEH